MGKSSPQSRSYQTLRKGSEVAGAGGKGVSDKQDKRDL